MPLNSYSTGTVAIAANATTIVGTGCNWLSPNARPGDIFFCNGYSTTIEDVTDGTHLSIEAWPFGGIAAGSAYKIFQISPLRFAGGQAMADVSTLIAALNTDGFYVFVPPTATVPDPSYGNDGQFAFQASTGKLWEKISGAWSFLGVYKAFGTPAPYDNAHTYSLMDVATSAGSSYVYINATPSAGNAPPNATYWDVLAAKGDAGAVGPTGAAAPIYGGTSTTSLAIGTGAQAFTTQAGLAYQSGARVRATNTADTTKWMEGVATYTSTTLTITVDKTNGTGTFASWNFNVAGQPGAGDLSSANNLSELTATAATARANLGINQAVALAASQDFNAIISPGSYYTIDATPVNAPTASHYYLRAELHTNNTFIRQIATRRSDGVTWTRILASGTWSGWKLDLTPDNAIQYDASQPTTYLQQAQARANTGVTKKNYIINGGMMVSQENGTTAGTANNYYPVDQFFSNFGVTTAVVSVAQVASLTPGGSPNRIRATVTTADASVTATKFYALTTKLEGLRIADLMFGSANAKSVALRVGMKAPAGTYCLAINNGSFNRSIVGEVVIASGEANTDVSKVVVFTGDVSGTWAADNTAGLVLFVTLMGGSNFQTTANVWTAGNAFATSNQFNFVGTNGNVFELFDVGLYEGSAAPAFTLNDYDDEFRDCMRFFYKIASVLFGSGTLRGGGTAVYAFVPLPTVMRAVPTATTTGVQCACGDTFVNFSTFSVGAIVANGIYCSANLASSAGSVGGSALFYCASGPFILNSRM